MRHRGTAVAVLLAVLAAVPSAAAARAPADLAVSPSRGVAPAAVEVSGGCPAVDDPDGSFFPTKTTLSVGGGATVSVSLDQNGRFAGLDVAVPGGSRPGAVPFATDCGGATSFTVLAAPALELVPDRAAPGAEVVASGTCPRRSRPPAVLFEGAILVTAPLDAATSEFGPATFTVPDDAGQGRQVVTTSCGGRATLTVLPPPTSPPTIPPDETLVEVPDLTGLTEAEAVAALGAQFVLANPTGQGGTVARQDPPPFARVRAGTAVTIVLEAAALEPAGTVPLVAVAGLGLVALLGLLAAAAATRAARRRRRERRWLSERVAVDTAASYVQLSEAPRRQVPGLDVELAVRRDVPPLQEVGDGRD